MDWNRTTAAATAVHQGRDGCRKTRRDHDDADDGDETTTTKLYVVMVDGGGQVQRVNSIYATTRWCATHTATALATAGLIKRGHQGSSCPAPHNASPRFPIPCSLFHCGLWSYGNDHIVCGRTAEMWPCFAKRSTVVHGPRTMCFIFFCVPAHPRTPH